MFELIPFDRRNHRVSVYDPFRALDEMERAFFGNQQPSVLSFRTDVSGIDVDRISASYTDGVLSLELPKKVEKAPEARRLEIQ